MLFNAKIIRFNWVKWALTRNGRNHKNLPHFCKIQTHNGLSLLRTFFYNHHYSTLQHLKKFFNSQTHTTLQIRTGHVFLSVVSLIGLSTIAIVQLLLTNIHTYTTSLPPTCYDPYTHFSLLFLSSNSSHTLAGFGYSWPGLSI
jgi:hypothetical protein